MDGSLLVRRNNPGPI